MRVMVFMKANADSEQGVMPTEQQLAAMMAYNEELVKAGVMLDGDGLQPSSKGARIQFSGGSSSVVDGPFTETKELIAGYWLWQVKSFGEALEWGKRCPSTGGDFELELRPLFDPADFGDAYTPEIQAQERRLRAQSAGHHRD